MTLLLPTTSTSIRAGSNAIGVCSLFDSSAIISRVRFTTGALFMICISLPRSCSQSPKICRSARSALWRSPRFTRMRPDDMYVVGVVSATVTTVAVVMRNRPRMIHLRRNSTARNSRAVAWRARGGVLLGGAKGFTSSFPSFSDDPRHEHAVEVEELPADERRAERLLGRTEELLCEHIDVADRGARDVDDVETADDLIG